MNIHADLLKATALVMLIIGAVVILFYGSAFLQPLAFGALLAMVVNPLYEKLMTAGAPKIVSIGISVLSILVVAGGILILVGWQISRVADDWPRLQDNLQQRMDKAENWAATTLNLSQENLAQRLDKAAEGFRQNLARYAGNLFSTLGSIFITLIYTILFLSEKDRLKSFVLRRVRDEEAARETMSDASNIAEAYLLGKLFVMAVLAVVYAVGFLLIGVEFAVLLAIIAALLSIIPYLGNIIGGGLAALLTLASGGLSAALLVIGVILIAQVLESYILQPLVVGEKVDLNPFASIVCVIGFGLVWGAGGAILALPLTGIIKIIFDHIPRLKDYGYLLGDDQA